MCRDVAERTIELSGSDPAFQELATILNSSNVEGTELGCSILAFFDFHGHPHQEQRTHEHRHTDFPWFLSSSNVWTSHWWFESSYFHVVSPKCHGNPVYPIGLGEWIRKTCRYEHR
jgi:hypothetical protein